MITSRRPTRSSLRLAIVAAIAACMLAACSGSSGATGALFSMAAGSSSTPAASSSPAQGYGPDCPAAPKPANLPTRWTTPPASASVFPQVLNSIVSCGPSRVLFSFTDSQNKPVAAPDRVATAAFYNLGKDPSTPVFTATGQFIWLIPNTSGVYVANVTFPESGDWGAVFTTAAAGGQPETIPLQFQVQPKSPSPVIGSKAPSVKTLTLADVGGDVKQVSTDPSPDPSFYQVSEDQALAQHKPFVLIFATPAFCTSRVCGPTLDRVKTFAKSHPDITFINVEPYKMSFTNGHLQPVLDANNQLQPNAATVAWNIYSEPWIFVVDGNGTVVGSFEAVASDQELSAAVAAALKG